MNIRLKRGRFPIIAGTVVALIGALLGSGSSPASGEERTQTTSLVTAASSKKSVTLKGWATFSGKAVAAGSDKHGELGPADPTDADLRYAAMIYRPENADFYIRWQVQKLQSRPGLVTNVVGDTSIFYGMTTEIKGTPVEIRVRPLGPATTFEFYKCVSEGACTLATTLEGVMGTTGEEVVVILPLSTLASDDVQLPVKEGQKIGRPFFFTTRAPVPGPLPPELYVDKIRTGKTSSVTVPKKSVRVYIGRHGKTASLSKGIFKVTFPRSYFKKSGKTRVKTRTCFGTSCKTQYFYVKP